MRKSDKRFAYTTVLLIALFLSAPVLAQSQPLVESDEDMVVQILRLLFGDVVNIISGGDRPTAPDSILGKLFMLWNATIVTLVGAAMGWTFFSWYFSAIHGQQNRDFDSVGIPIRMAIALGLSIPLGAGYSGAQLAHIWVAGHSIKTANDLANIYYDELYNGMVFTRASAFVSRDIPIQIYESNFCAQMAAAVDPSSYEDMTPTHSVYSNELKPGDEGLGWTINYELQYGVERLFSIFSDQDECGHFEVNFPVPYSKWTNGVPERQMVEDYLELVRNTHNVLKDQVAVYIENVIINPPDDEMQIKLYVDEQAALLAEEKRRFNAEVKLLYDEYVNNLSAVIRSRDNPVSAFEHLNPTELGVAAVGASYWVMSLKTKHVNDVMASMDLRLVTPIDQEILKHEDFEEYLTHLITITDGLGGKVNFGDNGPNQLINSFHEQARNTLLAINWLIAKGSDPLFTFMQIGHYLLGLVSIFAGGLIAGNIIVEGYEAIQAATPLLAIPASPKIALLKLLMKAVYAFILPIVGLGLLFAFWLPTLPLLHWMGGIIGAVVSVVENVILGPIHTLAHAFGAGRGMVGERAKQGYYMMFGSYLRFPLLVITFVAAYGLLIGIGSILFTLWLPFTNSMTSENMIGLLSFLGLLITLYALSVNMIERVFSIMTEINDRALKAIGTGAEPIAGLNEQKAGSRFEESSRSVGHGTQGVMNSPGDSGAGGDSTKPSPGEFRT